MEEALKDWPKLKLTAANASGKRSDDVRLIVLIVSRIWASDASRSAFWAESSTSRALSTSYSSRAAWLTGPSRSSARALDDVLGEGGLERFERRRGSSSVRSTAGNSAGRQPNSLRHCSRR